MPYRRFFSWTLVRALLVITILAAGVQAEIARILPCGGAESPRDDSRMQARAGGLIAFRHAGRFKRTLLSHGSRPCA